MKIPLCLCLSVVVGFSSFGQSPVFNVKELLTLKDHNSHFFDDYVVKKGYAYEKSKYDEKRHTYYYVFLPDIENNLHEIGYNKTDNSATITYGTTDILDYQQLKSQLALLQFRFVKYVPKQENGRSVLEIVYTDGHTGINLYNSYIENNDGILVRYYRIKIL